MKKSIFCLLAYFLATFVLLNCNGDTTITEDPVVVQEKMQILNNQSSNAINYEVIDNDFILRVFSDVDNTTYSSVIEVYDKAEVKLFDLNYTFNTSVDHWKILQKDHVLSMTSQLEQKGLSMSTLKDLSKFFRESIPIVYFDLIEPNGKDQVLFSSIHYYESAINTLLRSKETNTTISGTIHPGYLLGKNYFVFQEDDIVDLSIFNITELTESSKIQADKNLIQFISANSTQKVKFSTLYDLYNENGQFEDFLLSNIQVQTNGCNSNSCWIGCGGDLGCCGNYSGCCVYSHTLCLIHDIRCENCSYWHCGWDCKPTTPGTKTVKFLMG